MHRRRPCALAGCAAVLIAGCSAGGHGHSTAAAATHAKSASPTASATAGASPAGLAVPTPAAPSATGQLHVLLHEPFPVSSSDFLGAVATEAPDGSVFAAFGPQQAGAPAIPAGTAVYVVDGDQAPQVAEHPTVPIAALAADDTYLYVGGGSQIIEYARSTGAIARTWTVPLPVRLMTAGAGKLWGILGNVSGPGQVVEIDPQSDTVTTVGTDAAYVTSIAAGPLGLYYVEAGGATIVRVSPDGTRRQAPTHQAVNVQLSGPGAVQAVSVIGSLLLLIHDAGQGLDSSSQTYDASTLAGPLTNAQGTAGGNHAIGSLAGPVDLGIPDALTCAGTGCVGRYNLATGVITDAVSYPQSTRLGPLLGPYPALIVFPSHGHVYLDRIG